MVGVREDQPRNTFPASIKMGLILWNCWEIILSCVLKLRDGEHSPSFSVLGRGSSYSAVGLLFVLSLESDSPSYIWLLNASPQAVEQGGEAAVARCTTCSHQRQAAPSHHLQQRSVPSPLLCGDNVSPRAASSASSCCFKSVYMRAFMWSC